MASHQAEPQACLPLRTLPPQASTYAFNPASDCLAAAFASKVDVSFLGGVQKLRTGDILQVGRAALV